MMLIGRAVLTLGQRLTKDALILRHLCKVAWTLLKVARVDTGRWYMAVKTRGGPRVAGPVLAAQSPIPTTTGSAARRSGLVERYLQCEFTRLGVAI
jgi:hypothetical protein